MKPVSVDGKAEKVTIKAECRAEEGRKHLENVEVNTKDVDTVKYVEKKLVDKGVARMERHPADGLPLKHDPKKGHGGKYTWEGPDKGLDEAAPYAIDRGDPNYVEEDTAAVDDDDEEVKGLVQGEV